MSIAPRVKIAHPIETLTLLFSLLNFGMICFNGSCRRQLPKLLHSGLGLLGRLFEPSGQAGQQSLFVYLYF